MVDLICDNQLTLQTLPVFERLFQANLGLIVLEQSQDLVYDATGKVYEALDARFILHFYERVTLGIPLTFDYHIVQLVILFADSELQKTCQ